MKAETIAKTLGGPQQAENEDDEEACPVVLRGRLYGR